MPEPESVILASTCASRSVARGGSAARHGSLGQQQVRNTVAACPDCRESQAALRRFQGNEICAVLNWCSEWTNVSESIDSDSYRELVVEVREKLSRPLAISAARKLCCVSCRAPRQRITLCCFEEQSARSSNHGSGVLISCSHTPQAGRWNSACRPARAATPVTLAS